LATSNTSSKSRSVQQTSALGLLRRSERVRRLEADAAIAALVALRRTLIFGVRLADLLPCRRLRDRRSECCRAERRRAGECRTA
jgi:hypothetical protein